MLSWWTSWRIWWIGDKRRGGACGMGTLEGEEREVLPRWLIIGSAATWPHQAIGRPTKVTVRLYRERLRI
jgi:hypothetical protein